MFRYQFAKELTLVSRFNWKRLRTGEKEGDVEGIYHAGNSRFSLLYVQPADLRKGKLNSDFSLINAIKKGGGDRELAFT